MSIYNLNGTKVSSHKFEQSFNKEKVSLKHLHQGVYLVKIVLANGEVINKRIVKI